MDRNDKTQSDTDTEGPQKSQVLLNFLKLIFLVAVLIGAWYLLDWLISSK